MAGWLQYFTRFAWPTRWKIFKIHKNLSFVTSLFFQQTKLISFTVGSLKKNLFRLARPHL